LRNKRLILLVLSLCIAVVMIAGACTAPAPSPTPSPTPSPSPTPTPTTTPTPTPPAEEVFKWRWQSHQPPTDPEYASTIVNMVDRVEEMSDGRIQIELFSGGTLVPSTEIFASTKQGVFEIGSSAASYWKGIMPEMLVTIFPMGYRNGDDQSAVWFKAGLKEFMEESYDASGVKLLTMVQSPSMPLLSTRPINKVEDFEGLMIRTHSATALLVERLGANTIMIPGEEIYTALQLGTAEAMTWGGLSTLYLNNWYEQAKYVLEDPPMIPNFMNDDIYVNMDAWDSLPDDLKQVFLTAANLAYFENGVAFRTEDRIAKQKMLAAGVEFTTLSEADKLVVQEMAEEVWDIIADESPRAKQGVKIITDYLRLQGYTDYKIE